MLYKVIRVYAESLCLVVCTEDDRHGGKFDVRDSMLGLPARFFAANRIRIVFASCLPRRIILVAQDAVVNAFEIKKEGMEEVSSLLRKDMEKGLAREGPDVTVKMLITYVHALPDGTEEGDFLALDLGGSNFRVLLISTFS